MTELGRLRPLREFLEPRISHHAALSRLVRSGTAGDTLAPTGALLTAVNLPLLFVAGAYCSCCSNTVLKAVGMAVMAAAVARVIAPRVIGKDRDIMEAAGDAMGISSESRSVSAATMSGELALYLDTIFLSPLRYITSLHSSRCVYSHFLLLVIYGSLYVLGGLIPGRVLVLLAANAAIGFPIARSLGYVDKALAAVNPHLENARGKAGALCSAVAPYWNRYLGCPRKTTESSKGKEEQEAAAEKVREIAEKGRAEVAAKAAKAAKAVKKVQEKVVEKVSPAAADDDVVVAEDAENTAAADVEDINVEVPESKDSPGDSPMTPTAEEYEFVQAPEMD